MTSYNRPTIVCLCGSTRFMDAFQKANLDETLKGNIVLSIGCNTKSDTDLIALGELTEEKKKFLDELHKRKIDLADEVLILNVEGYIGDSTKSELEYAVKHNKKIRYLEKEKENKNMSKLIFSLRNSWIDGQKKKEEEIIQDVVMKENNWPSISNPKNYWFKDKQYWVDRIVNEINEDGTVNTTVIFHQLPK